MDPRKRVITELNRRIAEQAAQASIQLERLGDYLAGQDSGSFTDAAFLETHRRIQELRRKLPASRQQVRRIMQCIEKNADLEARIRSAAERCAEVEAENESLCERLGRGVYASLAENPPQRKAELEELFGKVSRLERELQALLEDQERNRTSMRTGNLFKIIGEAGRSFFLRSAVNFKRKAVSRAYAEAGRLFCESPLAEQLGEPDLRLLIDPYRENKKKLEELAQEGEGLRRQQAELWEELKSLGAEKSHQRRVSEIERQITRIEQDLKDSCRTLGELFRANPVRSFTADPEVKQRLQRLVQAEKTSEKYRKQIRRIEAAMRIDALEGQARLMREKIEKLSREIRSRQQEIRTLEKRIGEAESEKERLEKIRGSQQTLLQLDEQPEEGEQS